MNQPKLVRIQHAVYQTHAEALAAGYPDAGHGYWHKSWDPKSGVEGWIALDYEPEPEPDPAIRIVVDVGNSGQRHTWTMLEPA